MAKDRCGPELLAQSTMCEVYLCRHCGTYTIHVGFLSMRLKAGHFQDVVATLSSVLKQINPQAKPREAEATVIPFKH